MLSPLWWWKQTHAPAYADPRTLYTAQLVRGQVIIEAQIIASENVAEGEWEFALHIVAHCNEVILAEFKPIWGIDFALTADPNNYTLNVILTAIVEDYLQEATQAAHDNIYLMVEQAQETLKQLLDTCKIMQHVQVHSSEGRTITLSVSMARTVMARGGMDRKFVPFRLESETVGVALVYNRAGFVIARIGYDPSNLENYHSKGLFGLYLIPALTNQTNSEGNYHG